MPGRWPNLFVIGAPKAGTTSLHRYLDQHPQVFMSPTKEPDLFSYGWDRLADDPGDLETAKRDYRALFRDAGDVPVLGEASPSYLTHDRAPGRIASVVDDPRIVVSLRDPVERAYSHYLMGFRDGTRTRPFAEAVQVGLDRWRDGGRLMPFMGPSRYATHLQPWLDRFGPERVHVVLFPDLADDPRTVLDDLARFLDVDPSAMERVDVDRRHNPYRRPRGPLAHRIRTSSTVKTFARTVLPEPIRSALGDTLLMTRDDKPPLDPAAAETLWTELYGDEVDALEDLLGRDLPALQRTRPGRAGTTRPDRDAEGGR